MIMVWLLVPSPRQLVFAQIGVDAVADAARARHQTVGQGGRERL
jgi:hypothetical protein